MNNYKEYLDPDNGYALLKQVGNLPLAPHWIEVPEGAEFYIEMRTGLKVGCNFFFMFDDEDLRVFSGSGWQHASYDSIQEYIDEGDELLWSREQAQEQGLISGAEAKLAWANGESLQIRETGTTEWLPLADTYTLMVFDYDRYEIRKKPRTIKLELEIPAPFEPKDGETAFLLTNDRFGYMEIEYQGHSTTLGAWRTEEEIKQVVEQVVAALRGIKG